MSVGTLQTDLDRFMAEPLRAWIEARYYARVNAQAGFDLLIRDEQFWEAAGTPVGLFSDHGVVHVRDVAWQVVKALDTIAGLLIPARSADRLGGFMKSYGVLLAYLHDIGMVDFSAFGRAMHPEYAAQAVFTPEFDWFVDAVWGAGGALDTRLRRLAEAGALEQPPKQVLRELLALSVAHSKSKVPVTALNDRAALRAIMQRSVGTSLRAQYAEGQRRRALARGEPPAPAGAEHEPTPAQRHYADFARESFRWLVAEGTQVRALAEDAVDTLRALRAADALRQRGTVQKTSGGYEVYISQQTGYAVYALRLGGDQLYLLEIDDQHSAGEANIAGSELDAAGDLRISFHRGAFATHEALMRAVACAVTIVEDIRADVVESFGRADAAGLKPAGAIKTLLESTHDNYAFSELVCAELRARNPAGAATIEVVPSVWHVPELERLSYLAAPLLDWDRERRRALLERMAQAGCKVTTIDLDEAFRHVRLARLSPNEVLMLAGDPASMVYVPLSDGLRVLPLGGYAPFAVQAWMPLGNTGVIRGAARNGTVIAEREVDTLMIPRDIYLRHWHATYTEAELRERLAGLL